MQIWVSRLIGLSLLLNSCVSAMRFVVKRSKFVFFPLCDLYYETDAVHVIPNHLANYVVQINPVCHFKRIKCFVHRSGQHSV